MIKSKLKKTIVGVARRQRARQGQPAVLYLKEFRNLRGPSRCSSRSTTCCTGRSVGLRAARADQDVSSATFPAGKCHVLRGR